MELKPDMVVVHSEDFEEFLASRGDINTADQVGAVPLYDGRLVQFLITDAVPKGSTSYRQGRKWFRVNNTEVTNGEPLTTAEGVGGDADPAPTGTESTGVEQTADLSEADRPAPVDGLSRPGGVGTSAVSESTVDQEVPKATS
jgi:hypothetical protein